jgi:hypothetical protein
MSEQKSRDTWPAGFSASSAAIISERYTSGWRAAGDSSIAAPDELVGGAKASAGRLDTYALVAARAARPTATRDTFFSFFLTTVTLPSPCAAADAAASSTETALIRREIGPTPSFRSNDCFKRSICSCSN